MRVRARACTHTSGCVYITLIKFIRVSGRMHRLHTMPASGGQDPGWDVDGDFHGSLPKLLCRLNTNQYLLHSVL